MKAFTVLLVCVLLSLPAFALGVSEDPSALLNQQLAPPPVRHAVAAAAPAAAAAPVTQHAQEEQHPSLLAVHSQSQQTHLLKADLESALAVEDETQIANAPVSAHVTEAGQLSLDEQALIERRIKLPSAKKLFKKAIVNPLKKLGRGIKKFFGFGKKGKKRKAKAAAKAASKASVNAKIAKAKALKAAASLAKAKAKGKPAAVIQKKAAKAKKTAALAKLAKAVKKAAKKTAKMLKKAAKKGKKGPRDPSRPRKIFGLERPMMLPVKGTKIPSDPPKIIEYEAPPTNDRLKKKYAWPEKLQNALNTITSASNSRIDQIKREMKWTKAAKALVEELALKKTKVNVHVAALTKQIRTLLGKKKQIQNKQLQDKLVERLNETHQNLKKVRRQTHNIRKNQAKMIHHKEQLAHALEGIKRSLALLKGMKRKRQFPALGHGKKLEDQLSKFDPDLSFEKEADEVRALSFPDAVLAETDADADA